MSCPQEPIPQGWRVWRGPVPTPLTQAAMDVRDHVRQYARGTIAKTLVYNGQGVALFVSSHSWTYRNGQLVMGICIPGVSLLQAVPAGQQVTGVPDSLDQPDPAAAVYGADDVPFLKTRWGLVALSAGAGAAVVGAFWLATRLAGRRRLAA